MTNAILDQETNMIYLYIPVETGGSALILETKVFDAQTSTLRHLLTMQEDIYFEVGTTYRDSYQGTCSCIACVQ